MNKDILILQSDIIITVASWEVRYIAGICYLIELIKPKKIVMFYYNEYAKWSEKNRTKTQTLCLENKIDLVQIELFFSSTDKSWHSTINIIKSLFEESSSSITVDISTMPREQIWIICDLLTQHKLKLQYTYHSPEQYSNEWLSKDPGKPRFVYKLSGLSKINKPTTLVVLTGFDVERTKQLIRFYEPKNIIIGIQKGEQYANIEKNRQAHYKGLGRNKEIKWFEINGYSVNESLQAIEENVNQFIEGSNIVLTSLGPKISSLALFKFHQMNKSTSLAYAPSNEFNINYSSGYKSTIIDIFEYQ